MRAYLGNKDVDPIDVNADSMGTATTFTNACSMGGNTRVYECTVPESTATIETTAQHCVNAPNIDIDIDWRPFLNIPILGAELNVDVDGRGADTQFRVEVYVNGDNVGGGIISRDNVTLFGEVPVGSIVPNAQRQQINLRSENPNNGHFGVSENYNLTVHMGEHQRQTCGSPNQFASMQLSNYCPASVTSALYPQFKLVALQPPPIMVSMTECVSIILDGANVREEPNPTANIIENVEGQIRLVGYVDIPDVARFFRVEGKYIDEAGTLDEDLQGWISQEVIIGSPFTELCAQSNVNSSDGELNVFQLTPPPPIPIGTATATPNPPPTPTLAPDFSSAFPLPMDTISLNGNMARPTTLSRCGLHGYQVLGLDYNPFRGTEQYPVIAPADGEIVVLDDTDNGSLGLFVAIRIPMTNVPESLKTRMFSMNEFLVNPEEDYKFENVVSDIGAIYIGYGHLSQITTNLQVGSSVTRGLQLGYSGQTGNSTGNHLHLTVFYSEEQNRFGLDASRLPEPSQKPVTDQDWYFTTYDLADNRPDIFGQSTNVNPLVLWPSTQHQTSCPFWNFVPIDSFRTIP